MHHLMVRCCFMLLDLIELDNYLYMTIEINNLTASQIDKNLLRKVANRVMLREKIRKIDLSVAIVSPKRIKEFNKKYRGKNLITDVLAFPEPKNGLMSVNKILGEIIICPLQVRKNSKKFNSTFKLEMIRVLIHGILHLLGYNHEKLEKDAINMERKQNYYLSKIK